MREEPLVLHLPASLLTEGFNLARLISRDPRWSWAEGWVLLEHFALNDYETRFARSLLRARANLWLFRTNQRKGCGDFVVVDMSNPVPARRNTVVVELKLGEALSVGRGLNSPQLANHPLALEQLARDTGVIAIGCPVEGVRGDPDAVLRFLRVDTA